jgi:sugar/nucleoside kinase (ribokinase family)
MIPTVTTASRPLNTRRLVVLGEFFIDLVFYKLPTLPRMGLEVKTDFLSEFAGGGVATTALVAAGLGTSTAVVTRVGADAPRREAWQKLVRSGVSVRACELDPNLPTALTVCAAYGNDRMMITHDVINLKLEKLLARRSVQRQLRLAKHLHLACALRPPRAWLPVVRKLRASGMSISADIGWNPEVLESPLLRTLLRDFDFTFPNEIEARAMTGKSSVEKAAKELARWVRLPVVKLGPDGCLMVRGGGILRMPSIRVRCMDATGAGDAFNGGFLHGYLAGWSLEDCLRAGNICGALATTRAGGSSAIPTPRKLSDLMKRLR